MLGVKGDLERVLRAFLEKNKDKIDEFRENWSRSNGDLRRFTIPFIIQKLVQEAEKFPEDPMEDGFLKSGLNEIEHELELEKTGQYESPYFPEDIEKYTTYHRKNIKNLRERGFIDQAEWPADFIGTLFTEGLQVSKESDVYMASKELGVY